ncbi:FG-GAP-like repeat-containing protein [Acidicapsa dinghuensis]|uniref:FG-GAP-like repeat-containing protein n=1 Tax=Acidicapsa dinghuensis TaxID=2218256 RepID=A0ABW1ELE1_9BACT|nr:FG-GAP-like repeat-containing protein [Acidicapsa dinghuensis]
MTKLFARVCHADVLRLGLQLRHIAALLTIMLTGFWVTSSAMDWAIPVEAASKTSTTTTLTVTTGTGSTTNVTKGTTVTLTAKVTPASGTIYAGQVNFCDATAEYCTDIHVLGVAQVTSAGTAVLKLRPGIGSHSYKAVFPGTTSEAASFSAATQLTVTGTVGTLASTTAIAETGGWGSYQLTATVTEAGGTIAIAGPVSFLDTSTGNSVLATGQLGAAAPGIAWPNPKSLPGGLDNYFETVADLNGDGIPDLILGSNYVSIYLGNGDGSFTQAATPSLQGPTNYPIVVADFNGDGIPDLAVPMYGSNVISILLGKGDGTFAAPVAATVPGTLVDIPQIITGEFNGDGIPDLAVIDTQNAVVDILRGNGDGTFTAQATLPPISDVPTRIATGDFNGDGKADLAVSESGDTIAILTGNGDGTFAAAGIVHSGSPGSPVAVADFNGDGKVDLAVATGGSGGVAETVTILTGNGDGTFNAPSSSPSSNETAVTWIQVADFNQDGTPDVVLGDSNGTATVLLNDGSGSPSKSFLVVSGLSVPYYLEVGVGDLNGDGYPDIVAGGYYDSSLGVYLTKPTETTTATANVSLPIAGQHQVDANYGGDNQYNASFSGTIPLWGVPPATTTSLSITSSGKAVTSVAPNTVVKLTATVKAGASAVTAGQVNFCDATATYCTDVHLLGTAILSANGTASFQFVPGAGQHSYKAIFVEDGWGMSSASSAASLTVGPAPKPVYTDQTAIAVQGNPGQYSLTATVDGFGGTAPLTGKVSFIDTSFGNTVLGTASLGTSQAGMGWEISQTPTFDNDPMAQVTGDFNGDGIPDLAVLWSISTYNGPSGLTIFFGNGDGTFTAGPATTLALSNDQNGYLVCGDFNGDGKADVAVLTWENSTSSSIVVTLLGNGDGTFAAPQTSLAFQQGIVGGDGITGAMVSADFNGDGKLDLAVVGDYVNSGGVTVLLGNGDGTFKILGPNLASDQGFSTVATGDFNGDGIPDLVASEYFGPGGAMVFLGKGDGTFATPTPLAADSFAYSIVAGDFNGDGKLDLAFGYSGGVGLYLGNGDGSFNGPTSNNSGSGESLLMGDFNHDGKMDLAGLDTYNDQIDLFLGNGNGTFAETTTIPTVSQTTVGPFALAAADFNSDGVADLAMLTRYSQTASILLAEPSQTTTATVNGIAPVGVGTHNVKASYSGDGNYPASDSITAALSPGLAPVTFSPAAGTYTSVQTITLSESIPGATIYYWASGALSTSGFVPYTGPITVSGAGATSIEAYATETGYANSFYAYAQYSLQLPATATPTISLASGYYAAQQTVTVTDSTPGAKLYYTTNGTPPTVSSNLYTGPIAVSSSETLVVAALAYGYSLSPAASAQYVIGSSSTSFIYTIAGSGTLGYLGDNGSATLAQIDYPYNAVRDGSGNVYFSDSDNHVIRKVAANTGVVTTIAGTGKVGYKGDGGPATNAELAYPQALLLDSQGNLYIADDSNVVIRKMNLASGIITTYTGNPNATALGDGGPATAASIGYVTGLAMDSAGNLYLSEETAGSIREVTASNGIIQTIAGNGMNGYAGDGGPASSASFRNPEGLAFDKSGNLYIADSGNDVVRKITATSGVITGSSTISTVAGVVKVVNGYPQGGYSGDGGPAASAQLSEPVAVATDNASNLYISDSGNNVIRMVAAGTGNISTVAGNGSECASYGGDGGSATSASLCVPQGIAVDNAGNILIADQGSNRIREVFTAAAPSAPAATPTFSVSSGTYASLQTVTVADATPGASIYVTVDGSTPLTGSSPGYSLPIGVAGKVTIKAIATAPGSLTSAVASATYTIAASSPQIATIAGSGVSGFSGAGGPALDAEFNYLQGVAVDKAGNVYVSDIYNNVVWLISAATGKASVFAGSSSGYAGSGGDGGPATSASLAEPMGIALDSTGNLYIADSVNGRIRMVNAATGIITTVAGNGTLAEGNIGDGGPATAASLAAPIAVAVDAAGNIFIADTEHYVIREVSAKTGIITTVAGDGTNILSGDGGTATSAGIESPSVLAVDTNDNIYLTAWGTGTVRKVTASTGLITTVAGISEIFGATGDGGPATSAEIDPEWIGLDSAGNLYISNWPGTIREVNASSGIIARVAGIGFGGFSGDGGAALAAELYGPSGLGFDGSGNLYFADSYNYRVRKVMFAAQSAATPVFSLPGGAYNYAPNVTITDATANAAIYYTLDGSTPTSSSSLYSGPIAVSSSETINAIALAAGYNPSSVASAAYVISANPSAPALSSLSPAFVSAGAGAFTLTVNGTAFTPASTILWGANAMTTQFVSTTQLAAQVSARDVASAGIASVSVQTPAPGGGTSNTLEFEIDSAGGNGFPSFPSPTVTVTAGSTATYAVTLPSSATNVSVNCLNLPVGAACSYSTQSSSLVITTAATTPSGTYQITAVFTEMLPGAATGFVLLPIMLAPFALRKRRRAMRVWLIVSIGLVAAMVVAAGGCGGGGSTQTSPPQTHQVTNSGTVTLIVK